MNEKLRDLIEKQKHKRSNLVKGELPIKELPIKEQKEQPSINPLNDREYRALKREFYNAIDKGENQFDFKGTILLTKFAKYLLQYIEGIRIPRELPIYKRIANNMLMPIKNIEKHKETDEVWKQQ